MPMTAPYENKEYVVGFIEEWIAHAQSANHIVPTTSLDVQVLKAVLKLLKDCSSGPEDEAVALLIELHKFLDFEVPLQPGDMEIESPEGINEVFAKAYALINSRDATPQHTKEDV
jgi:hypothetical protein